MRPPADPPAALRQAYAEAWYRVDAAPTPFRLQPGQPCAALHALYRERGAKCALFISACNPFSRLCSEQVNAAAQQRLRAVLKQESDCVLEAVGGDPAGEWPDEPAFLALGLARERGLALGRAFDQYAVLWAGADAVPWLSWCFP
ncbi:DUF3293 domain-containing protein [Alkalilimnicola sp. S0819]|uniref:DUF3293 domain-containing protein n=1 Tax=Alkalilimnicola sp. S0819 TaxID=2613922 RepID=UPI001261F3FF|nr:DUF3293 domain-containing protein [Alkalilimnicola sp. S0819]KAB7627870.1 DUF3293 domain-containing protein [Alkalilimnicola sp. S0819]MPQ15505.1 DUF3293 domain-containing protein [Alkalilimnicola sp. S0819]